MNVVGIEVAENGWIGTFDLGSKAEIIPSSIAGSESTYKCDYHFHDVNSVKNRTLVVGGRVGDSGSNAGLGFFSSNNYVDSVSSDFGFRSLVRV